MTVIRENVKGSGVGWPAAHASRLLDWLPLLALPTVAAAFRHHLSPACFMWAIAFALYLGFKWLTYRHGIARRPDVPAATRLAYLLAWPGMSFEEFCTPPTPPIHSAGIARWVPPLARMIAGAGLISVGVPAVPDGFPLIQGWVGMVGAIMILHFGSFDLLALGLQAAGWNARPNMNRPLLSRSLADFWGNRWNTAFNTLANRYAFHPLTSRIGAKGASFAVFLASGLIHELVISVPAGGAHGLPTVYFLLQGVGLMVERLVFFRRHPAARRVLAWIVLAAPLGWLFPPVFVREVMLPMLRSLSLNPTTP